MGKAVIHSVTGKKINLKPRVRKILLCPEVANKHMCKTTTELKEK